jgi:hypothetical protein
MTGHNKKINIPEELVFGDFLILSRRVKTEEDLAIAAATNKAGVKGNYSRLGQVRGKILVLDVDNNSRKGVRA